MRDGWTEDPYYYLATTYTVFKISWLHIMTPKQTHTGVNYQTYTTQSQIMDYVQNNVSTHRKGVETYLKGGETVSLFRSIEALLRQYVTFIRGVNL